jgi:hypothetical protein
MSQSNRVAVIYQLRYVIGQIKAGDLRSARWHLEQALMLLTFEMIGKWVWPRPGEA